MLTASLGGHVHYRAFQQLEQTLLNAFPTHVAGDGGIVALTGNLVDFVDEDDTTLCFRHIVIGHLKQACQQAFDVFAYITGFGQHGSIDDGERHLQQLGNGACQQCLSRTGAAHHNDVGLFDFHIILAGLLQQAFVMIIYSYRQIALGIVLTDDVLVEECLDFCRFRQFLQVERT